MYIYMDPHICIYRLIYKHMYLLHLVLLSCGMLFLNISSPQVCHVPISCIMYV